MPKLHHISIAALLFLLVFSSGPVWGTAPEDDIRTADHLFNQGNSTQALAVYQQVRLSLEKSAPASPLLSEAINNIAAVYMSEDKIPEFQTYFAAAKTLKQQIGSKASVQKPQDQLLVNGGFEDGLIFPWGTGHYERGDGRFGFGVWWNSMNAKAFMKIDMDEKHSGKRSLRITNYSPVAPHVFTTLSQRIEGLKPNTIFRISGFARAKDLAPGAVSFAFDAAWVKRVSVLPAGTYDWTPFSSTINIGHNDTIDFRILHVNTGTVWLDDIVIREVGASGEPEPLQRVESLFDLAEYEEALRLCLELEEKHRDNKGALLQIRLQMGRIYQALGKHEKAFEAFNWVTGNGLKRANIDLGRLYYQLGDYETARDCFLKSYEIVRGDQGTESLILNELSRCHLALSQLDDAFETQKRSYRILKHIEDRHGQALSLNQLGEIQERRNDHEGARNAFLDALKAARQLADRKLESDILINLANTAFRSKDPDASSSYAKEALRIKEAINDSLGRVRGLHIRGRLDVARNRLEQARKSYLEAISLLDEISATVPDISRETKATFLRQFDQLYREYVELLLKMSQRSGAIRYQENAFPIVEQARSRVFTEMIAESRALRSFASGSSPEFGRRLEQERVLTVKIHALNEQLQKAREGNDGAAIKTISEHLDTATAQRRGVQAQLEREYPRYADLKSPKPLKAREVQGLLSNDEAVLSYFVTPGCTGLWAITREEMKFVVISLARDELIGRSERFRRGIAGMGEALGGPAASEPSADRSFQAAALGFSCQEAHELYRILVSPVQSLIRNKTFVFLVPDDLLYKLPFEALLTQPFSEGSRGRMVPGDSLVHAPFLVKTHCLSYLPSLSVLRSLRTLEKGKPSDRAPLLAFADPVFKLPERGERKVGQASGETTSLLIREFRARAILPGLYIPPLPDTAEEALQVARLLGASVERDVYLQARATEYNLKHQKLSGYRYLLFATHGLLAGEFGPGAQPALVFSFVNDPENDGLLEMGEILGLDFNADLAVLSACNTASGSGEEDRGEGFAGLTRSFMYAGARSLLVTEWSVESSSAKMLVQATFSRIKEGQPKAMALALAKRDLMASGTLMTFGSDRQVSIAHPYFWAPYVLVGEIR